MDPNAPVQNILNPDVHLLIQQLQQQAANIAALQVQLAAQAMAQPIIAPALIFALTPALAQTGNIDFSSAMGIKLRKSIMAPLMIPYDGTTAHLTQFLNKVKCHATVCSWENNLLLMISDQKQPPKNYHLITAHQYPTLENVHNHANQYVGQQNHTAQDAFIEFLCNSALPHHCCLCTCVS